jgi:RNA polymerase sigma factor for flagellar operon FliA
MDWVPRSVRARARDIERTIAQLEAKLTRAPTDEEIAGRLGITEEEFQDSLLEISRTSIAALDELWTSSSHGGDPVALIDTIEDPQAAEPQAAMAHTELREALGESIARLPEREKLVVTLYYYEELSLREIGEVLGVTESRVSQLHTKAILRLKARLSATVTHAARD